MTLNFLPLLFSLILFFLPLLVAPVYISFFEYPKRVFLFAISVLIYSFLFFRPNFFKMPKFTFTIKIILSVIFVLYAFSIIMNWPGPYLTPIMEWLALFSIFLFTFTLAKNNFQKIFSLVLYTNLLSSIVCLVHTLLGIKGIQIFPFLKTPEFVSFFGNPNLTAQFMGLSLLLKLHNFILHKNKFFRSFLILYYALTFLALIWLYCRSVFLSLLISVVSLIWHKKLSWKKYVPLATIFSLILVFIFSLPHFFSFDIQKKKNNSNLHTIPVFNESKNLQKTLSTQVRLARLINSLAMLMDRPLWGVGPDNYGFAYIPYKDAFMKDIGITEKEISRSPHNGFLEVGTESGIPIMLVLIFFTIYLFVQIQKIPNQKIKFFFATIFFYLISEITFSFPLELPTMSAYIIILLALLFAQLYPAQILVPKLNYLPVRSVSIGLCFFLAYWGYHYHLSNYYLWKYLFKQDQIVKACEYFPQNWRACTHQGELELFNEKLTSAEETLSKQLIKNPFNFTAIRSLGITKIFQGQKKIGCDLLGFYSFLLDGKINLDAKLYSYCPNIPLNIAQTVNK